MYRQLRQDQIVLANQELVQQIKRRAIADDKPQVWVTLVQMAQHLWQQIGAKCRRRAQADRPGKTGSQPVRRFHQRINIGKNGLSSGQHFTALGGQNRAGASAFHQTQPQCLFKISDLEAQRRLADPGPLGGFPVMPGPGEGGKVEQLFQRRLFLHLIGFSNLILQLYWIEPPDAQPQIWSVSPCVCGGCRPFGRRWALGRVSDAAARLTKGKRSHHTNGRIDMNMQVTGKVARLGARLVALGQRHRDFETRIARVESRPHPDQLILSRLKREKLRIKDEIQRYEGMLRLLGRSSGRTTQST